MLIQGCLPPLQTPGTAAGSVALEQRAENAVLMRLSGFCSSAEFWKVSVCFVFLVFVSSIAFEIVV